MSQSLSREIKKLKVRLSECTKEEETFLDYMGNCVRKLEKLDHYLELDSEERDFNRLIKHHREACEAFREALEKHSRFEHEKSHLLASYGAILATMERSFTDSLSQNYD